jgi:hypothetical protein
MSAVPKFFDKWRPTSQGMSRRLGRRGILILSSKEILSAASIQFKDVNAKSRNKTNKQTPWLQSASDLYRPRDRRLSVKLVSSFEDRGCSVVSTTDPNGRILCFLDRSPYLFFQVAQQKYIHTFISKASSISKNWDWVRREAAVDRSV